MQARAPGSRRRRGAPFQLLLSLLLLQQARLLIIASAPPAKLERRSGAPEASPAGRQQSASLAPEPREVGARWE